MVRWCVSSETSVAAAGARASASEQPPFLQGDTVLLASFRISTHLSIAELAERSRRMRARQLPPQPPPLQLQRQLRRSCPNLRWRSKFWSVCNAASSCLQLPPITFPVTHRVCAPCCAASVRQRGRAGRIAVGDAEPERSVFLLHNCLRALTHGRSLCCCCV